jgi:chemotaxis protein CheD
MSHASKLMDVFLQPGESFVGDAGFRIRTLLGSCVSITLWHPGKRIGGMSHFLLATRGHRKMLELDGRYGDEAVWLMLREMSRAGVNTAECEAKIFGGGNMFPQHSKVPSANVGQNNGDAARKLLQAYRIPIISESLFGVGHRQVIFDVGNGHVWSRQIKPVAISSAELTGEVA